MTDSQYVDRLIKGRCPKDGSLFTDDPKRPKMLCCPVCDYEIDTETYFTIIDEYIPPKNVNFDPDENLKKLNEL